MVVNRHHYMAVGGHRPEFRGHGYEDFELYHRLMALDGSLPRADDYYKDSKSWDGSTYNGFRSQLSLLGRAALMANLFVVHIWHPRPKKSSFYSGMQVNREIWLDIFKEFDSSCAMPEPLVASKFKSEKVVFFGSYGDNTQKCLRDIFPHLGHIIYVNEFDFFDSEREFFEKDFANFLKSYQITKILFPNPYGNAARLRIYEWCKKNGFPFLVFERGALPESWFIDGNGFNSESSSYLEDRWNKEFLPAEEDEVEKYIASVLGEQQALEAQGVRLGGAGLAQKLRIGNKKVLFVPLQRPSDTVIKYFAGDELGYEKFVECIDIAAARLKRLGWVVLCKKHPLEVVCPTIKNAIYVKEDTNFLDLLELSDAVALINSGVGVYSMMMGKSTYIFGEAFYQFDGLNVQVDEFDVDDFLEKLLRSYEFKREKMIRFIGYLFMNFYSYGIPQVKLRREADGSNRSITTGIDFYKIRIHNLLISEFLRDNRQAISKHAPLFERFKLDIHNKQQKSTSGTPVLALKNDNSEAIGNGVKKNGLPEVSGLKKNSQLIMGVSSNNKFRAKMMKFKNNPKKFFLDSKKPGIRLLHNFF